MTETESRVYDIVIADSAWRNTGIIVAKATVWGAQVLLDVFDGMYVVDEKALKNAILAKVDRFEANGFSARDALPGQPPGDFSEGTTLNRWRYLIKERV